MVQIERPDANGRRVLIIVPEFSPIDPRASIERTPQGSSGMYTVTFVLATPGKDVFRDSIDVEHFLQSGDSLLIFPKVAALSVTVMNDQESAAMAFFPNEQSAAARAQMRVTAANFREAISCGFNLIMPMLSWWSYHHDIAIDVAGYHVVEEKTLSTMVSVGLLGKMKGFNDAGRIVTPKFRPVLSSYREGANATNVFYQLLCFYRVIEGVKKIREERRQQTLAAGHAYREPPDERIPNQIADIGIADSLVLDSFRPHLGKKFTRVLEDLRENYRNAIAHLDLTKDVLVADNFDDIEKCEQVIPIIRYITRVMLHNEIAADPGGSYRVHQP